MFQRSSLSSNRGIAISSASQPSSANATAMVQSYALQVTDELDSDELGFQPTRHGPLPVVQSSQPPPGPPLSAPVGSISTSGSLLETSVICPEDASREEIYAVS